MGISAFATIYVGGARLSHRFVAGCCFLLTALWGGSSALAALEPGNVLVLYNAEDSDSASIADYYSQKRPGVRLLGLNGVTTDEEISASYYLSTIRPQVLSALDSSVDVIVTTKGLPLRIRIAESNPNAYTDPAGTSRTISSWNWRRYSSLESELTRIDSISTWQQMGDQSTSFTPSPVLAMNPYYWKTAPFSNSQYGIRLSSRLDGFTVADVQGMIDRASNAYYGQVGASSPFHFVVDDDPNAAGSAADNMERLRDFVLQPRNAQFTYDSGDDFIRSPAVSHPESSLVVGYVSHGIHGGAPVDYLVNPQTGINFQLANGAVFASWESLNAQTFTAGVPHSHGLVAEWIARGGTAGVGHVAEPYAGATTVAHEDALFDRLLNGMTFVEAAWGATYQLSYVNTVVGDPLMRFRPWLPGDITMSGNVDGNDLAVMLTSFFLPAGSQGFYDGDLNGDGDVGGDDLNILLTNFRNSSVRVATDSGGGAAIPEPASAILVGFALCQRLACRRAAVRRQRPQLDSTMSG